MRKSEEEDVPDQSYNQRLLHPNTIPLLLPFKFYDLHRMFIWLLKRFGFLSLNITDDAKTDRIVGFIGLIDSSDRRSAIDL